jgi:hypothetical protein
VLTPTGLLLGKQETALQFVLSPLASNWLVAEYVPLIVIAAAPLFTGNLRFTQFVALQAAFADVMVPLHEYPTVHVCAIAGIAQSSPNIRTAITFFIIPPMGVVCVACRTRPRRR